MNTIVAVFAAVLCLNGAFASPVVMPEDSRTILNTDSGMFLSLNTSTLVIGLVVIAALVVGLLAISSSGFLEGVSGQQQRYDQEQYYQQDGQHQYRTKRSYNESKSN